MNNILMIGLHGLIGSGKDTVAKMLAFILDNIGSSSTKEELWNEFNASGYNSNYATFENNKSISCITIGFADALKQLCSILFCVDLKCFYYNKSNGWICINRGFEYTETEPEKTITADMLYLNHDLYAYSNEECWMSLREVLVYVGSYIVQDAISETAFINIVDKKVKNATLHNPQLKYCICTDVRFATEYDYVKESNNGITINITRDSVIQSNNIAEHNLDDMDDYDFTIENNGSYKDLFFNVYDLISSNVIFKMHTEQLSNDVYMRVEKIADGSCLWRVIAKHPVKSISHSADGNIAKVVFNDGYVLSENDGNITYDINHGNFLLSVKV